MGRAVLLGVGCAAVLWLGVVAVPSDSADFAYLVVGAALGALVLGTVLNIRQRQLKGRAAVRFSATGIAAFVAAYMIGAVISVIMLGPIGP
jgi:multisubunit Na+/H+ antiporter MnhE subunit